MNREDWSRFVAESWEQKPEVVRDAIPAPLATEDELLALVQAACDPATRDDEAIHFAVGLQTIRDPAPYLPNAEDRSIAAYEARLRTMIGDAAFCLVIERVNLHHRGIWSRVCEALSGLNAEVGTLNKLEAILFLGNYRQTPTGIHKDFMDLILMPLLGEKRFVTWPDEAFPARDFDRHDVAGSRARGQTHVPGLRDLMYAPASYYHIGESDGGISASLTVAPLDKMLAG